MVQVEFKKLIYYIGIPVIFILLLTLRKNKVDNYLLLQYQIVCIFGYLGSVFDLKFRKIPNKLIIYMMIAWAVIIIPQVFLQTEVALNYIFKGLIGFLVGGGISFFVYLISRQGLGGGDVKFMAASGLYLGLDGVISMMLYGSIIAAITSLFLVLIKKVGKKDAIPLVPFLYLGILLIVFLS